MKKLLVGLLALGSISSYAQVGPASLEGKYKLITDISSSLCAPAIEISFNNDENQISYTYYIPEDEDFLTRIFELEKISYGKKTLKEARFVDGKVIEKIHLKDKEENFKEVSKTEIKIVEYNGEILIQKEEFTNGIVTDQCNYL